MLELVSSWALSASMHPILLIIAASTSILGCSMALYNARL
ncbi:MAG: hypothetical protein ACJA1U_002468, partial [Bermanella sp.]